MTRRANKREMRRAARRRREDWYVWKCPTCSQEWAKYGIKPKKRRAKKRTGSKAMTTQPKRKQP